MPSILVRPNTWRLNAENADGNNLVPTLQFAYYPFAGTIFDIAKNRSHDASFTSILQSTIAYGYPGANATTFVTPWSYARTKDVELPTFGVGVTGAWSIWIWFYVRAISSGVNDFCDIFGRYQYSSETNNQGWIFQKQPHNPGSDGTPRIGIDFFRNNGFANYRMFDSGTTLTAGTFYNYVAQIGYDVSGGVGTRELYKDSVQVANPIGNGMTAPTAGGLGIGGKLGTNDIVLLAAGVWKNRLNTAQMLTLSRDPYSLLAPDPRYSGLLKSYAVAGATGNPYYYLMAGRGNV